MKFNVIVKTYGNIFSLAQKREFFFLFFLSTIAMVLETVGIASIFPFLDIVFGNSENIRKFEFFSDHEIFASNYSIYVLIILIISFFLFKAIYLSFYNYKKSKFVYKMRTVQSDNLLNSYLKENYLFHVHNNSANLIRNIEDVHFLSVFARSLVDLLSEIILFLGILAFLLFFSPKITMGLTLFFGLIGFFSLKIVQKTLVSYGEKSKYLRGLKLKNVKESLESIRDIKILGKEFNFFKRFSKNNTEENLYSKRFEFIQSLPRVWFEFLGLMVMMSVMIYLIQSVTEKSTVIPILGVFALAAYKLIPSISKMTTSLQTINYCMPAIEPYLQNNIRLEKNFFEDSIHEKYKNKITFKNEINIKNLDFKYPNSKEQILKNLNTKIKKGEFIGIHGKSGSGKTTFVNILLGLLKSDSGQIDVDGKDIHENLRSWQNIISYIPQNVFVSDDTILKNIAYGEDEKNIDLSKVKESIKIANIEDFVSSLPNGLNTNCAELGDRFSGGQKQRIGIARAFYINSEILVFDEFTNFLDPKNEEEIIEEINLFKGNKTLIMISHKTSTLKNCNRIYKLIDKNLE